MAAAGGRRCFFAWGPNGIVGARERRSSSGAKAGNPQAGVVINEAHVDCLLLAGWAIGSSYCPPRCCWRCYLGAPLASKRLLVRTPPLVRGRRQAAAAASSSISRAGRRHALVLASYVRPTG